MILTPLDDLNSNWEGHLMLSFIIAGLYMKLDDISDGIEEAKPNKNQEATEKL